MNTLASNIPSSGTALKILVAITTQLILGQEALLTPNIMAAYFEDNHIPGAWSTIIPRSASSYVTYPTAGDLTSAQEHPTFKDYLVYKLRDCINTSVTFCNKKKVLVANAKIVVSPGEVNIAHLQQNDLVISQA